MNKESRRIAFKTTEEELQADPTLFLKSKITEKTKQMKQLDPRTFNYRIIYIAVLMVSLIAVIATRDRISQTESYHDFADKRRIISWIPNTFDVISNLPFLIVGLHGIFVTLNSSTENIQFWHEKISFLIFFTFISLVTFGSGYYHLKPNTMTLFWDRLPMAISFTSLFSILITENIDRKTGQYLFVPLLIFGFLSSLHWIYTEIFSKGDLRIYLISQIVSTVTSPFIILLFDSRYTHSYYYLFSFFFYLLAKITEFLDKPIYFFTFKLFSGHTLKHLSSALATEFLVFMLILRKKRRKI